MAKLYFYYSAMNAGKSTVLLQSNYNYNERGMDTLLYCPSIDDRYGVGKITSRIGLTADARMLDNKFDLYADVATEVAKRPNISCILVDEAQFLTKAQVEQICKVVDTLNIPVLCYGLRTDFQAVPFECKGQKVSQGAQIQIGGNDLYVATCRKHFNEGVANVGTIR
jgi:thymidine kinase